MQDFHGFPISLLGASSRPAGHRMTSLISVSSDLGQETAALNWIVWIRSANIYRVVHDHRVPSAVCILHDSTAFNRIQPHSTCWTCLTIGVVSFPDPGLHSWDSDNIFDDQGAITDSLFPSCKAREDAFLGDTMRCGSQVAQPMTPIYTHTSAFV